MRCLLSTCRHRADPHHCPLALPHCAVAPTAEQIAAVLVLASTEVEALQRRDHLALLSFLVDEVRKGAGSPFMFICRGIVCHTMGRCEACWMHYGWFVPTEFQMRKFSRVVGLSLTCLVLALIKAAQRKSVGCELCFTTNVT